MWVPRCNVVVLFLVGLSTTVGSRVQLRSQDSEVRSFLALGETVETACDSALEMLSSLQNASINHTQQQPVLATVKSHNVTAETAEKTANLRATNKTSVELKKEESKLINNQTSNHTLNHTAKLQQELGNLQHLFKHLKSRIGVINKDEHQGRDEDAKMIKEQEQIIQTAQKQLNWTNLTKDQRELRVNRTRSAESELIYWKKHRELSHGSFHANLKMSHGLMDKLQQTMKIFNKVLAGKKVEKKDIESIKRGLPSAKASFLQMVSSYFNL